MLRALWTSSTGMTTQQLYVDTIANNLANVNTNGFKKNRIDFQDLLYQTIRSPGASSSEGTQLPTGVMVGLGVKPEATQKIFSQGPLAETSNSLDVAIEGDGFFQILKPNGDTAYSRSGAFKVDSQGRLVTSDGFVLQPEITVPADTTAVSVGQDGTVEATVAGATTPTNIGQLTLAKFINPAGLQSEGKNLYLETVASGTPTVGNPGANGYGTLAQGFLELSNVQVVEEMVDLIVAQRAYEINSKSIQTSDDMLRLVAGLKR